MKHPVIKEEMIETNFESQFLNMYDIKHTEGKHYYNATRRRKDKLVCLMNDDEFINMLPDAVNCVTIVRIKGQEPKLYMNREFRYPLGQFVLNPPAGLIDPEDKLDSQPLIKTAIREIKEETGLVVKDTDRIFVANPGVFSSPGLTDESNGILCAVIDLDDESSLNQDGAEDTECFDGYVLLDKSQAREMLKSGRDDKDRYMSIFTYISLMFFVSDMWQE